MRQLFNQGEDRLLVMASWDDCLSEKAKAHIDQEYHAPSLFAFSIWHMLQRWCQCFLAYKELSSILVSQVSGNRPNCQTVRTRFSQEEYDFWRRCTQQPEPAALDALDYRGDRSAEGGRLQVGHRFGAKCLAGMQPDASSFVPNNLFWLGEHRR